MHAPAMIEAHGLAKSFGSVQALARLDLSVPAGTTMCLLGPNGAGKTTAVRVLCTLLRPDAGWARVAGYDVVADSAAVRQHIGMAGQYAAVDQCLTGRANLVMIGRLSRIPRKQARRRAAELLAALDLDPDDDDGIAAWTAWLAAAPPATRYAVACGPDGTGSILDIDHVRAAPASARGGVPRAGAAYVLDAPTPGLGDVRWATRDELVDRYDTDRPAEVVGDDWYDALERGEAVAIARYADGAPRDVVFCGVSGD